MGAFPTLPPASPAPSAPTNLSTSSRMPMPAAATAAAAVQSDIANRAWSPERIVSEGRVAFARLLNDVVRRPSEEELLYQLAQCLLTELYYRGKQYSQLLPTSNGIEYGEAGDYKLPKRRGSAGNNYDQFVFDYIFPVFKGDVNKIVALMAARAPKVKVSPILPSMVERLSLSRRAAKVVDFHTKVWNADNVNQVLIKKLCTSGTTFTRLVWNPDAGLYGNSPVSQSETQQVPGFTPYYQCSKCGAENDLAETQSAADPVNGVGKLRCSSCGGELKPYDLIEPDESDMLTETTPRITGMSANGCCELYLATVTTFQLPYATSDLNKADWAKEERYVSKWGAIQAYREQLTKPGMAALLKRLVMTQGKTASGATPGSDVHNLPEGARLDHRLKHPSGGYGYPESSRGMVLGTDLWIPQKLFEGLPGDKSGNLRQVMWDQFPNGAKLNYLDGELIHLTHESVSQTTSACSPGTGENLYEDPLFADYRDGIDLINDCVNILVQAANHSIGEIAFDSDLFDNEYLREYAAQHGTWLPVAKREGRQLGDHFFRIPGSDLDDAIRTFIDWALEKLRESKGVIPALFGGGDVEPTARGAEIRRNQAMMPHNIMWGNIRRCWEETHENAVAMVAARSTDKLYMKTKDVSKPQFILVPGLEELQEGGLAYTTDENHPMTAPQRREWIREMMENPNTYPVYSITSAETGKLIPQNIPRIHEAIGMDDWHIEDWNAYNYIQEVIHKLLEMGPEQMEGMEGLPGGQGQGLGQGSQLGQPPTDPNAPKRSPIPIEPNLIDPDFAITLLRDFILGDDGREYTDSQHPGMINVQAYLAEWIAYLQAEKEKERKRIAQQQAEATQQQAFAQAKGAVDAQPPPPPEPPAPETVPVSGGTNLT